MNDIDDRSRTTRRLLVVLDPDYGDRLRHVWPERPVWAAMSPVNEQVMRSIWDVAGVTSHLTVITGFRFDANLAAAESFLAILDDVDLHHGAYSSDSPYTELEVIGVSLIPPVHAALSKLGFAEFVEIENGFIASRTAAEACLRRR